MSVDEEEDLAAAASVKQRSAAIWQKALMSRVSLFITSAMTEAGLYL